MGFKIAKSSWRAFQQKVDGTGALPGSGRGGQQSRAILPGLNSGYISRAFRVALLHYPDMYRVSGGLWPRTGYLKRWFPNFP